MSGRATSSPDEGQSVSQVLDDPFLSRIVAACGEREMTRREFGEREGLDVGALKQSFEALERAKFLAVRRGMARGLRCNIYGAKRAAFFNDREFGEMNPERQHVCSRTTLSCFLRRFRRAWDEQALDVRHASHVSYRTLFVDDEGFRELAARFEAELDHQQEVQAASRDRLRESGEIQIPATAALFLFESLAEDALKNGSARFVSTEGSALALGTFERRRMTGMTLVNLLRLCARGLQTGVLDRRDDSHVSWAPLVVDRAGFGELEHGLVLTRNLVDRVEQKAHRRLLRSDEVPIAITVGFVVFESPAGDAPLQEMENESR